MPTGKPGTGPYSKKAKTKNILAFGKAHKKQPHKITELDDPIFQRPYRASRMQDSALALPTKLFWRYHNNEGAVRIWNQSWSFDQFEVMGANDFEQCRIMMARFGIPLIEAIELY